MTALSDLKLYSTHPHPCSYLEGESATTLFIDPQTPMNQLIYSQLADVGFRRSGSHVYRPHCEKCHACLAARIPVDDFQTKRKQRKILNRNKDLTVEEVDDISSDEYYTLYQQYINSRHQDGDMYPPSKEQYESFLTREWDITKFFCFRQKEQILAIAVVDFLTQGLAAVYTYFDTTSEAERRSLGSYAILWEIQKAKELGLAYVYLGYWIKDCQKMNYKIDYRPLELLINNRWTRIS